jgi:hypothetical protein
MKITETSLKIYDRLLATISALAIIIGGLWSLNGLQKEKVKENELKLKENELRRQQIKLDIFLDKKAAYYELCEAAAEVAACNSYDEVMVAKKKYIKSYLGKAHIIAQLDDSVGYLKVMYKFKIDDYLSEKPDKTPYQYFGGEALKLTSTCKKQLDVRQIYKSN